MGVLNESNLNAHWTQCYLNLSLASQIMAGWIQVRQHLEFYEESEESWRVGEYLVRYVQVQHQNHSLLQNNPHHYHFT